MPDHYKTDFTTDKASLRYYSYLDLLKSKLKLFFFFNKIKSGKAVIIKNNVEIRIAKKGSIFFGDHTVIDKDANIILTDPFPNLIIGKYVKLGKGCIITCKKKILIGDETRIGDYATIRDNLHQFVSKKNPSVKSKSRIDEVMIGKRVWIGSYCTIFPGVKIGDNSIISTYSLVDRNVPKNVLVAGQPARIIKKI